MKRYNRLSRADKNAIKLVMREVIEVGYGPSVLRFIEDELYKSIHPDYRVSVCKKCGKVRYKVSLRHAYNVPPKKPRLCVECAPPKDTRTFKPKAPLLVR